MDMHYANKFKTIVDDNVYVIIRIFCNVDLLDPIDESTGEKCDIEHKIFTYGLLDKTFYHIFDCNYDSANVLKIHRESFAPEIISTLVDVENDTITTLATIAPVIRYSLMIHSEQLKPCNINVTYLYNGKDFIKCNNLGNFTSRAEFANKWYDFIQASNAVQTLDNVIYDYDSVSNQDQVADQIESNDSDKTCIIHNSENASETTFLSKIKIDPIKDPKTQKSKQSIIRSDLYRQPNQIKNGRQSSIKSDKRLIEMQHIKQNIIKEVPIMNQKIKEKPYVIKVITTEKTVNIFVNDTVHLNINKHFIEINNNMAQKLLGLQSANFSNNSNTIYTKKNNKKEYQKIKKNLLRDELGINCLKILFNDVVSRYNFDVNMFMNKYNEHLVEKLFKNKIIKEQILLISLSNLRKRLNIDNLGYKILNCREVEEFMEKEHYEFKVVATSSYDSSYVIIKELLI